MDRFEAMRTLVAAIDGGSLSAASRSLGIPLPTVSRRVSDLETHLRAQLVVRTSRKLLLTDVGRAYLATCRRVLEELDEAERTATGEYHAPRGELHITAPVMFGRLHVQPVVLAFLSAYPQINVRLTLADYYIDLIENRIDAAVRIGSLPDSGMIAKRLGMVRWLYCASPGYLTANGTPSRPEELKLHETICFDRSQADSVWQFVIDGEVRPLTIKPRFSVNTAANAIDAATAGAGIIRVLSYQVAEALAAGQLVALFEEFQTEPFPVQLIFGGQPALPTKVRAFLDFAAPRLRERVSRVEGSQSQR